MKDKITLRAIILAILLVPLHSYLILYLELVGKVDVSWSAIMIPTLFILTLLTLTNALLQKFLPNKAFSPSELYLIFIILTISVFISCLNFVQRLVPALSSMFYYTKPENMWDKKLYHLFPKWALAENSEKLIGFFEGGEKVVPWAIWIKPLIIWGIFMVVLMMALLFLMAFFQRSWVGREKLSFPMIFLPTEMMNDSLGFYSNKLMWLGFFTPFLLYTLAFLHILFPYIPCVPLNAIRIDKYISVAPWKHIGYTVFIFWPFVIAIGYLINSNVSFSCWFFYFLTKAEIIFGALMGWKEHGVPLAVERFPYISEQCTGAFLGLALFCIYNSRKSIAEVFIRAFSNKKNNSIEEWVPSRTVVFGFLACFIFLIVFSWFAGLGIVVSLILFSLYFLMMITIARLRAEAGTPFIMTPPLDPQQIMINFGGTAFLPPKGLSIFALYRWFTTRLHSPTPNQIEGFKMSSNRKMNHQLLIFLLFVAIVIALVVSYFVILKIYYQYGGATAKITHTSAYRDVKPIFSDLANWLDRPTKKGLDLLGMRVVIFSVFFTGFLFVMRSIFLWWPFHPVGYVMSLSEDFAVAWSAIFIGWFIKSIIIKYGGAKLYRKSIPFFLGVILGEFFTLVIWTGIGEMIKIPISQVFGGY